MYENFTPPTKFNLMIAAMIFGTLLTTGCRKDNDSTVFTAVMPNYDGAKDYIDGSMVFWSDGDSVRVNNGTFTVTVSNGDRHRATINAEGAEAIGGEYFAAYPADIASITNANHVTFSLPQEETYTTDGGRQVIHSVMAAKAHDHTFQFQNVCALLHFKASTNVSGTKLRAVEVVTDKPMWGTIATEYSSNQWHVTSVTGTGNTSRTLRFDTPLALSSEAKDIYLIIPPVSNATSFTLRLTVDDGTVKVFEKSKEGSFSFAGGYLYHFDDINTYTSSGMKFGNSDPSATVTNGSEEHPYLVYSSENWNNLASAMTTANKHITLANDINVSSTLSGNFKAILDGNGHTITLTTQNISLFSTIEGGTVKNLIIDATNDVISPITTIISGQKYYGSLAGKAAGGRIENCSNYIDIQCVADENCNNIGGLIGGANNCFITNCINHGSITANCTNIGGIVGQTGSMTAIGDCTNYGDITISSNYSSVNTTQCGGIAGYVALSNNTDTVKNCHNYGDITLSVASGYDLSVGGVFGKAICNVKKCSNSGTISCNNTSSRLKYIGGIVGDISPTNPSTISNCFNEGHITSISNASGLYAAGIVCMNIRAHIYNCYSYGNLSGTKVAGIVAYGNNLYINAQISNCYFYGTLTCNTSSKYGIAGTSYKNKKFLIDHCYYPSEYNLCHSSGDDASTDNGNNATLSSATTLTNDSSLATALHNNLLNMPTGSYDWQNSTSGPAHVVFVTGSK